MNLLREYISEVLEGDTAKIAVSGDVMFGRYVGQTYHPLEIRDPFRQVQSVFRNADFSIVNLETPLYDGAPTWWKKYPLPRENYQKTLVAPTDKVGDLVNAGISCVSLANNHADDAGYEGFDSTAQALDTAGILHAGTNTSGDPFAPLLTQVKDKPIALFSATLVRNFGSSWGDANEYQAPVAHIDGADSYEKLLTSIELIRSENPDIFIFVALHWGVQYNSEVEPWQEILAKDVVDAGANCILGHHPHVLQKVSKYKNAVIFFSLGNLLFDHNYDIPGHASKKNSNTLNGAIYVFEIKQDNSIGSIRMIQTKSTPEGVII